jgi:alanine-glyoxylate transaminase/serine-glyoxylate transaminase/serine-pyruvate transaminase
MSTYVDPPRRLLLGPGPSPVAPRVYEAMSRPITGIFDAYFSRVLEEHQDGLRRAFGTANRYTTAISGTGSAGMEACVSNLVETGTKMAVFANGFFCDRITEMGRRYGATVARLEKPWGEVFTDAEAAEFVDREKPQVVAFVNAETSTGAFQKGKAICDAAHAAGAVVIADCVTSLGAMPVNLDATGIDAAYSCSQKGLGAPPGLAPVSFSERAVERIRARKSPNPCWYLDAVLLEEYFLASPRKYHVTIPIPLFYALREALAIIDEEGLENRWERHRRNHLAFVEGVEAMGLRMHVAPEHRLWSLNTVRVPEGIDDLKVRKRLLDDQGIEVLGGFGALAGKVFRVGLMGSGSTAENVRIILEALGEALAAEGYRVPAGVAG